MLIHHGGPVGPAEAWTAWNWDPIVWLVVVVPAVVYVELWRRAGRRDSTARWRRRSFLAGIAALAVALLSPLDAMGGSLASAHMVQHLLLTTVAAPLLVLGVRWRVLVGGLPLARATAHRPGGGRRRVARAGSVRAGPPGRGEPAVRRRAVGAGTPRGRTRRRSPTRSCTASSTPASWPPRCCRGRRSSPRRVAGRGAGHGRARAVRAGDGERPARCAADVRPDAVVSVLRRRRPRRGDSTPLEDQQLAGVIMWVPGGGAYLVAALVLVAVWVRAPTANRPRPVLTPGQGHI